MFREFPWYAVLVVLAVIAAIYYLASIAFPIKKLSFQTGRNSKGHHIRKIDKDVLPELIDKPADHPIEQISFSLENPDDEQMLEIVDDQDSRLLKEAEKVIAEIQETVAAPAIHPPAPSQILSNLKSIVSKYKIFENTEYFEAINNFIAITVERDCSMKFSKEQLQSLWG